MFLICMASRVKLNFESMDFTCSGKLELLLVHTISANFEYTVVRGPVAFICVDKTIN